MRPSPSTLSLTFLAAVGLFTAGVAATAAIAAPPPPPADTAAPALPAAPSAAPAAPETPAPSSSASADPTATPSGAASAAPAPPLPLVRGADIPVDSSPKPKEAEWREGTQVRPNRGGDRCTLVLVREWLRVTCKDAAGLGLIAGDPKGVTLWTGGSIFSGGDVLALVQFPLTRGASRIVGFTDVDGGWDWVGLAEGGTMSVTWREGEPDPVIGIYRTGEHDK